MTRELKVSECKGTCDWRDSGDLLDGEALFVCAGCGSEWTPSQSWTPTNADGTKAAGVMNARAAIAQPDDDPGDQKAQGGGASSW